MGGYRSSPEWMAVVCDRKRRYDSPGEALQAKRDRERMGAPRLRYYFCDLCVGYHLTSKPLRRRRRRLVAKRKAKARKKADPFNFRMPSGSNLEVAEACPGAFALPHAAEWNTRLQTGSDIHDYLAHAIIGGEESAEAFLETVKDEDVVARCRAIDPDAALEELLGGGLQEYQAEVKLQYDPWDRSSHLLSRYGESSGEKWKPTRITTKLDLLGIYSARNRLKVVDWKTGSPEFSGDTPPEENRQLQSYAISAASYHGADEVVVSLAYPLENGALVEVPEGGHTMDQMDLDAAAGDIRRIAGSVYAQQKQVRAGGQPKVTEGPWCARCPAIHSCPAKVGAFRALATLPEKVEPLEPEDLAERLATMKPEEVGEAYARFSLAKAVVKKAEQGFKLYADHEGISGIPLPGGAQEMALVEQEKVQVDVAEFFRLFTEQTTDATTGATLELLREPLEDLVKAFRPDAVTKTGIKAFAKALGYQWQPILEDLEDSGGVSRSPFTKLQKRKRREE